MQEQMLELLDAVKSKFVLGLTFKLLNLVGTSPTSSLVPRISCALLEHLPSYLPAPSIPLSL